ncbi:MAG TPA: hypothetical protein VJT15_22710 [Pyrinomonadaceae bacterium]|nr:hypothetical protein [Pyrinomonadaceae bacterium]
MFFRKFLVAGFLLVFTATAASAYTVVMRNGRRVEIPNTFTLTKSTLTYETAPGIQITIQLASIDVTATERVNGQNPGAFLATASQPKAPAPVTAPVQTQRVTAARSITNQDLEVYRRARLEGERERQELGLPSAEERRLEVEEIDNRMQEQIREKRSQEELDFWRNRATQLEAQMNTAGAQTVGNPYIDPYGVGLVSGGFVSEFDGFHRFNRFNRFKNASGFNNRFGFNPGFNILNPAFPGQFKSRLRFTIPKSGGGGRGGSRGGRR